MQLYEDTVYDCQCLCDYAATVLVVTSLSFHGFVVWYATPISAMYIH